MSIEDNAIEDKISSSDITIDEIIYCIRGIIGEYISSAEKVGQIRNFVESIEVEGDRAVKKRERVK